MALSAINLLSDVTSNTKIIAIDSVSDIENIGSESETAVSASYVPWSGVQNKQIASATELGLVKIGNNLTIDADGTLNATGSGGGGSTEGIRYKLITKTLQEGTYNNQSVLTCQIDDRTITTIVVSIREKNVVLYMPPKPADGGARDFIIRVEVTASTAPGFYFIGASETINYDSGDENWNVLEPGLNLISFTETK